MCSGLVLMVFLDLLVKTMPFDVWIYIYVYIPWFRVLVGIRRKWIGECQIPLLRWSDSREFADSRESLDSRESFRVPELNPFFANRPSGGLKIANRSFEAIRANRWHVLKIGFFVSVSRFVRIDSRESPQFGLRIAGPSTCRFSKCRFSAELEKIGKYSRWGVASKNKSKNPWVCIFTLLPCRNRCRFSESGFLFRRCTYQRK